MFNEEEKRDKLGVRLGEGVDISVGLVNLGKLGLFSG
jgi:hypothetical protein